MSLISKLNIIAGSIFWHGSEQKRISSKSPSVGMDFCLPDWNHFPESVIAFLLPQINISGEKTIN